MKKPEHDTLVRRLAMVLIKLNRGERLEPAALAEEFSVNIRTIQRDLNERFGYLPLEKIEGRYRLDPSYLGKLDTRDIERFASLAGVKGLFPSFSEDFLRDIFDSRIQAALLIRGHNYEDLSGKQDQFSQLEQAIIGQHLLSFRYGPEGNAKVYDCIEPYKLVNDKGIWYLAARDGGKLKTFSFTRITGLAVSDSTFKPDPAVEKTLASDDGFWSGDEKTEIVLKVGKDVAGYFKRRKLISNQVIEKELEDGGLILSAKVGHINQVIAIVRYWIPHLRIISPEGYQLALEKDLAEYLKPAGR